MPQRDILSRCPLRSATLRALLQGGPVKRESKTARRNPKTQMGTTEGEQHVSVPSSEVLMSKSECRGF